jgi:hypothetical protein
VLRWFALAVVIVCAGVTLGSAQATFHSPHDFVFTSANYTGSPERYK